jgi:hypothetical protein
MTQLTDLSPFVLCIDDNPGFLHAAMVCIQSISDTTPGAEVIVATYNMSEAKRDALQHWARVALHPKSGLTLSIEDVSGLDIEQLPIAETSRFGYSSAIS